MITASHLPSHRNGFKLFTKAGGLSKQNIAEVRGEVSRAHIDMFPSPTSRQSINRCDFSPPVTGVALHPLGLLHAKGFDRAEANVTACLLSFLVVGQKV